jgi:hypothetical protein
MSDQKQMNDILITFSNAIKEGQVIWALKEKNDDNWMISDSLNFEDTEVMPLWSSEELAKKHCIEEWSDYIAAPISVNDWLEFWIEDLLSDNIIIGINWTEEGENIELDLPEFTQAISEIEKL